MSSQMEKHLFNLKFTAKQLERDAKKSEKQIGVEKAKLKKCIQRGDTDSARIHAENAIRNKSQALNFRKMSARIDAVASRVQSAVTTQQVTRSMGGVVKAMDSAMRSMNLEKVSQLMDSFESQFESLDVQTQVMEGAMGGVTTLSAPDDQVNSLMGEAADECGIELSMAMPQGQTATVGSATVEREQDELSDRLAKLRQT